MHIIKLDAIGSTNTYLKYLAEANMPKDFTVIIATHQTCGRGQMGTIWESEPYKNLTFSILKKLQAITLDEQFFVSMAVSLAICKTLKHFLIPKVRIKWPNDILSEKKKICGILIENLLKNNKLEACIIGIGLNVNQKFFNNLHKATSMNLLTGTIFNTDEILSKLLQEITFYVDLVSKKRFNALKNEYELRLFRNHKISTFKSLSGEVFTGIIKGLNFKGQLQIITEDRIIKTYNFKEVIILY